MLGRIPCAGKVLDIDLTRQKIDIGEISDSVREAYLGGVGYAAKVLWDETSKDTGALSPENVLVFATGPLSGLNVQASSRHIVAGVSPLTGIWGEAHSGGNWADELRHAGFEAIIVRGRAEAPLYLWIHDGRAELRPAGHVWGRDSFDTQEILERETAARASVACIGQAGEKQVRLAAIMNDGKLGRAAARCGLGAVMGAKNLKAIVARGTGDIAVADEQALKQAVRAIYQKAPIVKHEDAIDKEVDTLKSFFRVGGAPIKNWLLGTWAPGEHLADHLHETKPEFCRHCPYSHMESKMTAEGERAQVWEHWAPLGTQCLVDDVAALQESYSLCNRYGLDSISVGGAISMAMECYEKGLLTKADTGGLDLSWGNGAVLPRLITLIGEAEGFGALLGQGVAAMAEQIGSPSHEYAIHTKRLELPAHDPRAANGYAITYATSNLGACHVEAVGLPFLEGYLDEDKPEGIVELGYPLKMKRFAEQDKARLAIMCQNLGGFVSSLTVCWSRYTLMMGRANVYPSYWLALLNAATGWDLSIQDALRIGERIFTLKRMFNVRKGISRKDDTLPARILCHKRGDGGAADYLPNLGAMLNDYYQLRGWSEEGIPTERKLAELGLEECRAHCVG